MFAQQGYHSVNMEDIGATAGITGAAIYRHFPDKEALLVGVAERSVEDLHRAFSNCDTPTDHEAVAALVSALVTVTVNRRDIIDVYARESRYITPGRRQHFADVQRDNNRLWTHGLRRVDPHLNDDCAVFLLQASGGLARSVTRYQTRTRKDRLIEMLTEVGSGAVIAALDNPSTVSSETETFASRVPNCRRRVDTSPPMIVRGSRREMLMSTAVHLFWHRGFNGVGVDEIAAAAGIRGPSAYTHFAGKESILWAALNRVVEQLATGVDRAFAEDNTDAALDHLITSHIEAVVNSPELIGVYVTSAASLSDKHAAQLQRRQKSIVDDWIYLARQLQPSLDERAAHVRVHAVHGMIDSFSRHPDLLAPAEAAGLLKVMTRHIMLGR